MKGFFWEHFESAVWNGIVLFRVRLVSVGFGLIWDDNLDMSFRTKRATIEEGYSSLYTLPVNKESCSNVI